MGQGTSRRGNRLRVLVVLLLVSLGFSGWQHWNVRRAALVEQAQRAKALAARIHVMTPEEREKAKARRMAVDAELAKEQQADQKRLWTSVTARELVGHQDGVLALAFSPDGQCLASGGADHTVRIWDVATGKELQKLEGHFGIVEVVAFSTDGKLLISGGDDGNIIAWNAGTGEIEGMWKPGYYVQSMAIIPGSRSFVTFHDNSLDTWQVDVSERLMRYQAEQPILSIAATADGGVVTGDSSGSVILWDVSTGQQLLQRKRARTPYNATNSIRELHLLRNGDMLVCDDEQVWEWNLKTGEMKSLLKVCAYHPSLIAGGQAMAFTFGDSTICLQGIARELQWSLRGSDPLYAMVASPDGTTLAVGWGGIFRDNQWISDGPKSVQLLDARGMLNRATVPRQPRRVTLGKTAAVATPVGLGATTEPADPYPWR